MTIPPEPVFDRALGLDTISGLTDREVREELVYLIAGVEQYLPVRDGEEAAGWLYVQAMRRARLECEEAKRRLGHYPLCEALDHPGIEDYCSCSRWSDQ